MTPDIHNLILAGTADLYAASRYRILADQNPSLARDYRRRADLADQLGKKKLDEAGQKTLDERPSNPNPQPTSIQTQKDAA